MKSNRALLAGAVAALLMVSGAAGAAERKLAFAIRGVVAEVMARTGQSVDAGQALARLDTRPLEARRKAAVARLQSARITLEYAKKNKNDTKQLFDDLSASGEDLEKAEIRLAEARAKHARARARTEIIAWKLARATLRAPAAGTVRGVPGYPGMVVNPNASIDPVVILDIR